MSDSKWVNRNLRAGASPKGIPGAGTTPSFRREHGRKKSSRPMQMRTRRSRRTHDKKIGARLFFTVIIAACIVITLVVAFYSNIHRFTTNKGSWSNLPGSPFALAPGLEPVAHNPAELVDKFLNATTRDQLAALCRTDDNSPEILDEHADEVLAWLRGHRESMPMHEAKANGLMFTVFGVAHVEERPRPIYVVQTAEGPRIDIGAFLAWSSEDWSALADGTAKSAAIVRTTATRVAYYNYGFNDENVFQSYRLDPPFEGPSVYGYALRGSAGEAVLNQLIGDSFSTLVVISLDQGERGADHRQFRISRVIAAGWAMGPDIAEDHLPKIYSDPQIMTPLDPAIPGSATGTPGNPD